MHWRWLSRLFAATVVTITIAAPLAMFAARADAGVGFPTVFSYTGAEQTYTVPAGVTSVHVDAIGGAGGAGAVVINSQASGGHGANVSADVPVTPGETLYVEVGGNGANGAVGTAITPQPGAFNGGGAVSSTASMDDSAGGGGGASDVRTCPRIASSCVASLSTLTSRLLVAGGGGGGAADTPAGSGGAGGDAAQAGGGGTGSSPSNGGDPGTADGPGAGGAGVEVDNGHMTPSGNSGAFGSGAGDHASGDDGAGTGGGGWFGGGEGAADATPEGGSVAGGGGGGGSNYVAQNATNISIATDTTGSPQITIAPIYQSPTVLMTPTTDITRTSATLNGVVNAHEAPTEFWFEYADDKTYHANSASEDPYDHNVPLGGIANRDDETDSAPITGLTPGTTYHVRLQAIGPGGEVNSFDQTFTTAPK